MNTFETVWSFSTAHFTIALEIEPEDMDSADSFEFEDDIEAVRSGAVEWFQARVAVYQDGTLVGSNSLGGCAYNSTQEFYSSHRDPNPMNRNCSIMRSARGAICICHYFPDMVREAISEARKHIYNTPKLRCA